MATRSLKPRLLFVDAYDSFAQNIVVLFRDALDAEVTFTTIDDKTFNSLRDEDFTKYLQQWDGVIVGPGPGNPINPADVGWSTRLWSLSEQDLVPVLGICLGFQSLCLHFGAHIRRLKEPKHGIIGSIVVKGGSILADKDADDTYKVTHYHSLTVHAEGDPNQPWSPLRDYPKLTALAWDFTDEINGPILQAVRHKDRPFWGVQYHPESICSENGPLLARNWWKEVNKWRDTAYRFGDHDDQELPYSTLFPVSTPLHNQSIPTDGILDFIRYSGVGRLGGTVAYNSITSRRLTVENICRALNLTKSEVVVLESGTSRDGSPLHTHTGRTSIIGIVSEQSSHLAYYCSARKMTILYPKSGYELCQRTPDPWPLLNLWTEQSRGLGGAVDSPFWGGLIGFVSYEAGLQTSLGLGPEQGPVHISDDKGRRRPDIAFVHVRKSIVIDHVRGTVYVQILRRSHDPTWLEATTTALTELAETHEKENSVKNGTEISLHEESKYCNALRPQIAVSKPPKQRYWNNLRSCDEEIRAGNSYELCLTDQSIVRTQISGLANEYAWSLYCALVQRNAAPFSAFLRLQTKDQGVTIVSSSPERFLSWSRSGLCEYRPIKGTVKKGPDMTLGKATQILSTSKEIAENLMIADLIRHDLNSVPGIEGVRVPELFKVEEYATVYQLVSVIQGDLPLPPSCANGIEGGSAYGDQQIDQGGPNGTDINPERSNQSTGIDVLRRSLPPGSMTGAPKLRSCQILQGLEQKSRGIYSGVLGYLDCGGGGDFSVVIRTAYSWDDEDEIVREGTVKKSWHVGAGGAVTAQSTLQGEWDEMLAKADTILNVFGSS